MKSNVIKRCNTCGRFLSEDDFGWNNKQKGYRSSQCKKCTKVIKFLWGKYNKEYKKQYYLNNKEQIKEYNKKYNIINKDIISNQKKQYYKENKEKIDTKNKQWCKNNKEKIKIYKKQWRKDNPEKIIQYCIDNKECNKKCCIQWRKNNLAKVAAFNANYRTLKEEQSPDLTKEEQDRVKRLYEICKQLNHNGKDFHVDHIKPLSKGGLHHPDNLQILPNWLNQSKKDKWPLTEDEQIRYEGFRI